MNPKKLPPANAKALPPPPTGLGKEAAAIWRSIVKVYAIDDAPAKMLLESTCRAWQMLGEAQKLVDEHGILITGAAGHLVQNPAAAVVKDSRNAVLAGLKALRLDTELPELAKPGRPAHLDGIPGRLYGNA